MRVIYIGALFLVVLGALAWGSTLGFGTGLAVTTEVSIVDFAFSPSTVTIEAGSSVRWTNRGIPHTATSDGGLWDSGILTSDQQFPFTFNTPGNFPYHCTIHPFMTGTIVVTAATPTPTSTPWPHQLYLPLALREFAAGW